MSSAPPYPVSSQGLRRAGAFTLVELLAVIAVVGVLAAILMVAAGRARQSARDTQCTATIRQVALATQLYAGDHKGKFPNTTGGYAHKAIIEYLNVSIKDDAQKIHFLDCPGTFIKANGSEANWIYGFNRDISEQLLSSVARPSRLILATCSTTQWLEAAGLRTIPKPHSGKVSVVRLTGNVTREKVSTIRYADIRLNPGDSDETAYLLGDPQYDQ